MTKSNDKRKKEGIFKEHLDDKKNKDTATDVYYKTDKIDPDTGVAIPTEDAVEEAKDWIEENRR